MARDGEGTKERRVGNFGVETHFFFEWHRNDGKTWKVNIWEEPWKITCKIVGRVFPGVPWGQPTLRKIWRTVLRGNLSRPVFMVDFPYIMSLVLEVLWLGM